MLRPGDFDSSVWGRFREFLSERLDSHRDTLEDGALSDRDTIALRGQIVEIRYLLSLPELPSPTDLAADITE